MKEEDLKSQELQIAIDGQANAVKQYLLMKNMNYELIKEIERLKSSPKYIEAGISKSTKDKIIKAGIEAAQEVFPEEEYKQKLQLFIITVKGKLEELNEV